MRLIDGNKLLEVIAEQERWNVPDFVYESIKNAPTIDAEPVIRCKDCAFYWYQKLKRDGSPDKRYNPSYCHYWGKGRNPNEYCSRAVDGASLDNALREAEEECERKLK